MVLLDRTGNSACPVALTATLRKFRPLQPLNPTRNSATVSAPTLTSKFRPNPLSSSPEPKQLIISQHFSYSLPHFYPKGERTTPRKRHSQSVSITFSVINEVVLTSLTLPSCLYYLYTFYFVFVYPFTLRCINTTRQGRGTVTRNAYGQSPPHRK